MIGKLLKKPLFTIGKFNIRVWLVGLIVIITLGSIKVKVNNINIKYERGVEDLMDYTGEYTYEKSERIMGEMTWVKSKLIMEKEGQNYKYTIDEITGVGRSDINKKHFEGTMSDKIFTVSMKDGGEWDWSLLGDNEIVERGGSFILFSGHFDNNSTINWRNKLVLSFDKDKGYSQMFQRD